MSLTVLLLLLALTPGCGGSEAPTIAESVESVGVLLATSSITVGTTTQATASIRDVVGNLLSGHPIAWSSSSPSVATVNATTGLIQGIAAGTATITAISEGKSGTAVVTVTDVVGVAGVLSGTVKDVNAAVVGGGVVEVLSGAAVVQTANVASNGTYSFATLDPGTYGVRLQPPLTHSMGPAEPAQRTATIVAGQPATVSFVVQRAVFSDDFQAYTTATLVAGCGAIPPAGSFFAGANHDMGCDSRQQISIDPTGGPNGTKAMRYDWPAKPITSVLASYCASETSIDVSPRFNPSPVFSDTIWIRFTSKESAGFLQGAQPCAALVGISYKFFLLQMGPNNSGGANGRFGMYATNTFTGQLVPPAIVTDMTDRTNFAALPRALTLGSSFYGSYHTWAIQIYDMRTAAATFKVYLDGVVFATLVGPFYPGISTIGGSGQSMVLSLGANINNGPEAAQSRWFREIGVYYTRPSLRPLAP